MLHAVAAVDVLVNGPVAVVQRRGLEDVLGASGRGVAGELAERPFLLPHVLENPPLDDDLRPPGHVDVHGGAARELQRLPQEPSLQRELLGSGRRQRQGPQRDQRVHADADRGFQALPLFLGPAEILEHAPPGVKAHPQLARPLELHPVKTHRAHARLRIPRHHQARGHVGAAVLLEMGQNGKLPQIHRLVQQTVFLKGSVLRHRGLYGLLDPLLELVNQPFLRRAEGPGQPRTVRQHVGRRDEVTPGDVPEHHRGARRQPFGLHDQGGGLELRRYGFVDFQELLGALVLQSLQETL